MKLRRAALAVVVWYLMVPPSDVIGIPMANWERAGVFETKGQCEKVATPRLRRLFSGGTIPWTITNPGINYGPNWNSPKCVSSDDPRFTKVVSRIWWKRHKRLERVERF
jgi:hypothetical protein